VNRIYDEHHNKLMSIEAVVDAFLKPK